MGTVMWLHDGSVPKQAISGASSSEDEKNRTAQAIAGALSGARQDIQMRQLCHFFRADMDYGMRVAKALYPYHHICTI